MKLLPLFILLALFTAFPAYAVQRNLEISWELPIDTGITPEEYRLYIDGNNDPVCITKTNTTSMVCSLDLPGDSAVFTLTSYGAGKESPHSRPFEYTFVDYALSAVFSTNPSSGDAPLPVSFNAGSSTGNIVSYTWDFGDGAGAYGKSVHHEYTVAGNYLARLTVTDDKGEESTQSTQITVTRASGSNGSPHAAIHVNLQTGQSPLKVRFDASGSSDPDGEPLTYSWNFGDGSKGAGKTINHTYFTAGVIEATLTVSDPHNAISTANIHINVTPHSNDQHTPHAVISMSPSHKIIVNNICKLSGAHSIPSEEHATISSYQWDFGDGSTDSGKFVQHVYSTPGIYIVTLTIQDSKGTFAQSKQTVHVIGLDKANNMLLLQQIYRLLLNKQHTRQQQ